MCLATRVFRRDIRGRICLCTLFCADDRGSVANGSSSGAAVGSKQSGAGSKDDELDFDKWQVCALKGLRDIALDHHFAEVSMTAPITCVFVHFSENRDPVSGLCAQSDCIGKGHQESYLTHAQQLI